MKQSNLRQSRKKILVVFSHPKTNSFSHALKEAVVRGLEKAQVEVIVQDLYKNQFDPLLYDREKNDLNPVTIQMQKNVT